jgi:hypothetical protein
MLMAFATLLRPQTGRLRPKPISTPNELEFFTRLRHAIPHLLVFPQMAMAAIIRVYHVSMPGGVMLLATVSYGNGVP